MAKNEEQQVLQEIVNSKQIIAISQVNLTLFQCIIQYNYQLLSRGVATKNEFVDDLNDKLILQFTWNKKTYNSFDETIDDTHNYYQEESLNSLTLKGLPPHKLILKKNCPIILLRNLNPSNGLCNGTRMVCKDFKCYTC